MTPADLAGLLGGPGTAALPADTTADQTAVFEAPTERVVRLRGGGTASAAELEAVVGPGTARPDRRARHLGDPAEAVTRFEARCPALPMGDEHPNEVHRARLAFAATARRALADGLGRLGVGAPERL